MIRQIAFTAQNNISFQENLNICLNHIESSSDKKHILGVIFFIDTESDADYFEKKKEIDAVINERNLIMPFNVQAQSTGSAVSTEIWLDDSASMIEHDNFDGIRYSRVSSPTGKSVWGIGVTSSNDELSLNSQIDYAFYTASCILQKEGMNLTDIVRQWNYVPGILKMKEEGGKMMQHYQIFNEVRQKYYSKYAFSDGYPAATGIGTRNGNYDLDFYAIQKSSLVHKIGLSNPKQSDAYDYDQKHLVGDAISGDTKKTPLFERAKILETHECVMLFISGTASIIGQETVGIGDAKRQTEVTIDNILELIQTKNTLKIGKKDYRFTYLRVYIKEDYDFPAVIAVCETRFSGIPISYLKTDVCRKDLLVEIEGEAIFVD
jgi:enamine deaminase RidA (YjgF/YER057c/UK114 family)